MKSILFFISVFFMANSYGQNKQLVIKKINFFPEGLTVDDKTGKLYSASMMTGNFVEGNLENSLLKDFKLENSNIPPNALGMRVKDQKIFVATGENASIWGLDLSDRVVISKWSVVDNNSNSKSFINDLSFISSNLAIVTDSFRPVLYSFSPLDQSGKLKIWLNLKGSSILYDEGYNLNGISVTEDAKHIVVMQTNTGKLFKINLKNKEISSIKLSGGSIVNGDGISFHGKDLYIAINKEGRLAKVTFNNDMSQGQVSYIKEDLSFPTAVTIYNNKIYVLNSHLDEFSVNSRVEKFEIEEIPLK